MKSQIQEPTVEEMKTLASTFNAEEWATLIENEKFVKMYDKDLKYVEKLSKRILGKEENR